MNLGRRIVYDSITGGIVLDTGEETNATERPVWNGITYIDIPFGQDSDKYSRVVKYHVDINTKKVVFDQLGPVIVTDDAKFNALFKSVLAFNTQINNNNKLATLTEEIVNALKTVIIGSGN
ncbi:hypothetical protein [Clostridium scatologenes]|uniref:Phage protein n=1 Tax=Clostridium scatologenes TaxID=1548 RepID=A0A0E3JZR1_CLOSL|nr:hypothetical protein [Clostridium scatologenes]AKA68564.1 hypothetical protein CSCA_1439 [Clostridium scatologenes]